MARLNLITDTRKIRDSQSNKDDIDNVFASLFGKKSMEQSMENRKEE
jgi:hypothetical protein